MKKNRLKSQQVQIAMAAGALVVFAGCQGTPVTKAPIDESTVGGPAGLAKAPLNGNTPVAPGQSNANQANPDQTTSGAVGAGPGETAFQPGQVNAGNPAAQPGTPAAAQPGTPAAVAVVPDAKVSGRVLDVNGKPIAGMRVNTYNGFTAVTDERGNFTIDVKGQDGLRLDMSKPGYLNRQVNVSVSAGEIGNVNLAMKPLDAKVTTISAATGGSAFSADGKSQMIFPPGALTKDSDVRLTWMDPMPSANFPHAFGELPGPLVTRTLPSGAGAGDGEEVTIPPIAFTALEFTRGRLAPGAQATLRMKVNPEALRLAGDNIDFNNPVTLQQPCYDFDRATGLWTKPALSKLEKDADGTVWFIYTVRGDEAPKNFFNLLQAVSTGGYVTGQQLVTWPEQEDYTYNDSVYQSWPGGGGSWVTVTRTATRTVTRSRYDDLFGKQFTGNVTERSSNSALNNQPLAGATVSHQQDFYGGTSKTTDGGGSFTVPMWHNTGSVSVSGARYFSANSTGGGFNMVVPTDGSVKANILGGSLAMSASNSNLSAESWTGAINKVASRASAITIAGPTAPVYLREAGKASTGTVPVAGVLDLGQFTLLRDYVMRVKEFVVGTDNARQPNRAVHDSNLAGAAMSGFTDYLTGATSGTSGSDGSFKFTLLANAAAPKVDADFRGARGSAVASGTITLKTDSSLTLTLTEPNSAAVISGESVTVKYTVDDVKYQVVRNLTGKKLTLVFARDTADNALKVQIDSIESAEAIIKVIPAAVNLGVADNKDQDVVMKPKLLAK